MEIVREQDVVVSRQRARELAGLLGFSGPDQVRVATSVSEIARNVHQCGQTGLLDFSLELDSRPQVLWMSITSKGTVTTDFLATPDRHFEEEAHKPPGAASDKRGTSADLAAVSESVVRSFSEAHKPPGAASDKSGASADLAAAGESVVRGSSDPGLSIGIDGTRRLMDLFEILTPSPQRTVIRFGKRLPSSSGVFTRTNADEFRGTLAQQRPADPLKELQRQNRDLLQTLETLRLREIELEKREEELSNLNVELNETNRGVVALYGELDEKAVALRRADEMKSRFLWHVSHEFRTPLNAVQALAHLLLDQADGPLTAEQEKQVTYIRKAACDLTEMVNDLLDVAKVDSGKADMRWASFEVSQLLSGIRGLMRPLADNDAVKLIFEEPLQPISIVSDESKVSQILRNLISNALKFTQAGSVNVTVELSAGGGSLSFIVSDTGIGIEGSDLERIFKDFEQVANPVQKNVKGTGLGLPLSRKLAGLLGGKLEVTSKPGIGSAFSLTIPVCPTQAHKPPGAAPDKRGTAADLAAAGESVVRGSSEAHRPLDAAPNERGTRRTWPHPACPLCASSLEDKGSLKADGDRQSSRDETKAGSILVIDDDEASRYIVRHLFSGTRYRVIEARDGAEGFHLAQQASPTLIILDLFMPGRNGFEVLNDLQSDAATRDVPVVIHSSRELDAEVSGRLSNRILTILPKNRGSRRGALTAIRSHLGDPALFSEEPEFLRG